MKLTRLLIANRGEIAVRIAGTARRLGIETVAVYSGADRNALHVQLADQAVCIGPASPAESYLNIDNILAAARERQADAIHPGYGFLSENPAFQEACTAAGITFVGPSADVIRLMGLKGEAKKKMADAGVPVLPGTLLTPETDESGIAMEIGYPVLIKPEAGGGGKGMKIVRHAGDLQSAIESARREALGAFGNDALLMEKFLDHPRHIEIQIFADTHGNCIHLYERDCSSQRRHQKIIEEAPATSLTAELRERIGSAAVDAARAIGYTGAGTVEFLLDGEAFYFMEMNTRLQVEHPVTELVTGQDLVEWQLRVARGETLPLSQAQVAMNGHAIEARIYAEDPLQDFLPASGRISHLRLPEDIRTDNGVQPGDDIGVYYDPMLMKIIANGDSREVARQGLARALSGLEIAGIRTNRDFLLHLLDSESFRRGEITTDTIDQGTGFDAPAPEELLEAMAAACHYLLRSEYPSRHTGFRLNQKDRTRMILFAGEQRYDLEVTEERNHLIIESSLGRHTLRKNATAAVHRQDCHLTVFMPTRTIVVDLPSPDSRHTDSQGGGVRAPMSGKLVALEVSSGEEVSANTPLAVIEAMKMEHTILAPDDGRVNEIYYATGDMVDEGAEILDFEITDRDPEIQ